MKAILEFNLDDLDESTQHDLALAGSRLAYVISEFSQQSLRARIKYRSEEFTEKELELLQALREELFALVNEENVGDLV